MRELRVYDAVAVEGAFYKSGRPVFQAGERLKVEVSGETLYVCSQMRGEMLYSTDDEDWVWKHLLLEAPWRVFSQWGKEDNQNG